jgi:hypothetical protein
MRTLLLTLLIGLSPWCPAAQFHLIVVAPQVTPSSVSTLRKHLRMLAEQLLAIARLPHHLKIPGQADQLLDERD